MKNPAAVALGSLTSPAKAAAARANGAKGGRPKKPVFDRMLDTLPVACELVFDPLVATTPADLWFMVRAELDLYEQNDEDVTDFTPARARQAKKWLKKWEAVSQ